jgi:surface protein
MENMFKYCSSLNSLDISTFDTSSVENMDSMFYSCSKISSLDFSNFNTLKVENMDNMFKNCSSLTSLDLSSFDTSSVTSMSSMLHDCYNLDYVNLHNFREKTGVKVSNLISGTKDKITYCINDESLTPQISLQFHSKRCEYLDCDKINWPDNLAALIEEIDNGGTNIYSKCYEAEGPNLDDFYQYNEEPGISIYSYEIGDSNSLKQEHTNLTFIEFSDALKRQILAKFGRNPNEKLYVFISDLPSDDERMPVSEYDYKFMAEDGTILDLSQITDDLKVSVSVPIRDLDLANFEYAQQFAANGYDIYDKNSDFYIDPCTAAFLHKDDIPLKDRKKDIYPNVTICKGSNCIYKKSNLNDKRIVCECNLNANKMNETGEDDFMYTSDDDVGNYILENINYKIIRCYYLLLDFKNLVNNPAFYVMVLIFASMLFCSLKFMFFGIQKIRINMYNELPTDAKVKEETRIQLQKMKENMINVEKKKKNNPPKKEKEKKSNKNIKKKDKEIKSERVKLKKKKKRESQSSASGFNQTDFFKKVKKSNLKKGNYIDYKTTTNETFVDRDKKEEDLIVVQTPASPDEINKSPFSQAVREDKRSCCRVFCSLLFDKVEFLHLFAQNVYFRTILICQFLTSLVLDFFFNSFFYSDDVVSRKYHNNGNLDFAVTLALSVISALFTAIIMHYLQRTLIFEEWLKQIKVIKREYKYLFALNKFLKYLKIQIAIFFIIEILIILWGYYYICIFFIIYSQSRKSLLLNFFTSLMEGLIKTLIIIVAIVLSRRIGIICKSSYLYNTSKFLDENF